MPTRVLSVCLVVALCAGVGAAGRAAASPGEAAAKQAEARAAFEVGAEAYEAGRFSEALASYERAYRLSARPKLLFNIARAADGDAQAGRALDAYQAYLLAMPSAPNRNFVESRIAKLKAGLIDRRTLGPTLERAQPSTGPRKRVVWREQDELWYRHNRRMARTGGAVALLGVLTTVSCVLPPNDSAKLGVFVLGFVTFGVGEAMVAAANLRGAKEMRRRGISLSKVTGILSVVGVFAPPLLWVSAPIQSARLREAHEQVAPARLGASVRPSGLTLRFSF